MACYCFHQYKNFSVLCFLSCDRFASQHISTKTITGLALLTLPIPLHDAILAPTLLINHFSCRRHILCAFCVLLVRWESPLLTTSANSASVLHPAANDIMQYFSCTNHLLHTAHVVYQLQSKPYRLTTLSAFTYFPKNAALSMNKSKPVFPKKCSNQTKLKTKISSQTEFTMSRRLSAHN